MMMRILSAALLFTFAALPATAQEANRALTKVKGDVWRFQNNFHYSMLIETADGVVVTDPINAEAASWLKAEIYERFQKPVIYLIYSHSHGDHASGGSIFAETAVVIAEANSPAEIDGVVPDYRIAERSLLRVGGKTLELVPIGPGHGQDMMVVVVRPENVAFVVDVVSPGRLPYRDFPGADINGLMDQIRAVQALRFEIMLPGHSRLGNQSDSEEALAYLQWLKEAVASQLRAGKSVDEIVANLDTSRWSNMMAYDQWMDLNIQGMARWLEASGELQN
ncbi:MAG: MBL fold metallo-hydrolase [Limibacillus sp.]